MRPGVRQPAVWEPGHEGLKIKVYHQTAYLINLSLSSKFLLKDFLHLQFWQKLSDALWCTLVLTQSANLFSYEYIEIIEIYESLNENIILSFTNLRLCQQEQ